MSFCQVLLVQVMCPVYLLSFAFACPKHGLLTPIKHAANGLRPYHAESTGSRPITEVKPRRAWLVLGWATALEPQVL